MWRLDFAMYNKNTAYLLFEKKNDFNIVYYIKHVHKQQRKINKSKMILFFNGLVGECRHGASLICVKGGPI